MLVRAVACHAGHREPHTRAGIGLCKYHGVGVAILLTWWYQPVPGHRAGVGRGMRHGSLREAHTRAGPGFC